MQTHDFYYDLPQELIAQHPMEQRDHSRLLVLDPQHRSWEHRHFNDLPSYLEAGDCLVLNDTKVIPARLIGRKLGSGIPVEFLLLKRLTDREWEVLVRPGRRLQVGARAEFLENELSAEVLEILPGGNRRVRFDFEGIWEEILDRAGTMPLPPYITERLEDPTRYNTVYAVHEGSAAAPTAGLHFTPALLKELEDKGVELVYLTLHVGLGTFRPVQTEDIADHLMHSEYYEFSEEAAARLTACRNRGGKIYSVGTTSTRVLESVWKKYGAFCADRDNTSIFIYPGCPLQAIDGLITNFHLPESTLVMLVSALAGRRFVLSAYEEAIKERYRFFSFGDAMFIRNKIDPAISFDY